jgi:hypothetical protein
MTAPSVLMFARTRGVTLSTAAYRSYARKVDAYVAGRPEYPAAMLEELPDGGPKNQARNWNWLHSQKYLILNHTVTTSFQ